MANDEHLRLDRQLCFALYAASRAMMQAYQPLLAPLGITYPQYLVLLVLWEHDDQSVGQLGDHLQLDSGTLTPLLKRMEAQGLIHRRRSTRDERVVHARLTPQGSALREQAKTIPEQMACKTGLEVADLGHLRDQIHSLTARLRRAAT